MVKEIIIFALMAIVGVAANDGGRTIPPAINNINNSALISSAMNNKEIWKDVKDFEGLYQVSNLGNMKSLDRIVLNKRYGEQRIKGRLLKGVKQKDRYHQYCLYSDDTKNVGTRINGHRLVAIAFIQNIDNKPFINHINGNKYDNRVDNLEWVTQSENELHSYRILGKKHPLLGKSGKLSKNSKAIIQTDMNGNFIAEYFGQSEASRITGLHTSNINAVCRGINKSTGGFKFINKQS